MDFEFDTLIVKWLSGFYISLFSGWVVFTCHCLAGEWFLHVTVLWLNGFCMPLYSGSEGITCHGSLVNLFLHVKVFV